MFMMFLFFMLHGASAACASWCPSYTMFPLCPFICPRNELIELRRQLRAKTEELALSLESTEILLQASNQTFQGQLEECTLKKKKIPKTLFLVGASAILALKCVCDQWTGT